MDKLAPITRGRKFDQVIEGATKVFLRDGFASASVDDIARESGVSKATLYSYFSDKRAMFSEMVRVECASRADEAVSHIDFTAPIDEILRQIGYQILKLNTSPFGIAFFRLSVSEAARFPELAPMLYENGLGQIEALFVPVLDAAVEIGSLRPHDTTLSAHQFTALMEAQLWPKVVFGLRSNPAPSDFDPIVTSAVEMFMAQYGDKD